MTITGRAVTQKNGGAPEGGRRNKHMSNVAELVHETKSAPVFSGPSPVNLASRWIDEQVRKAAGRVTSQVIELTPDLAEALLARNPDNRRLRERRVAELAADISNDNWKLNGEPIIVSSDGLLNDGQHRCSAVVMSGKPISVVMIFGVERDSRDTLDQGTQRSAADYLEMHGSEDTAHLAAAARALWQYQNFGFIHPTNQNMAPTRTAVKRTALDHPGLVKSLAFVSRRGTKALSARSLLAFCHFSFKRIAGEQAANYFMDAFIDGADLERGDPILYVRNRFIAEKRHLRMHERCELLFRAWNAHRRGEKRVLLRCTGGELPLLEA